jgi:hypothetical protein
MSESTPAGSAGAPFSISFVMSQEMVRGIRDRAERRAGVLD